MTISTTTTLNRYTGNAVTTVFPYTYRILAATDLVVTKRSASTLVESTLAYGVDYSVSGVGNTSGGSVTLTVAPASGDLLVVERAVPATQPTSIRNQGSYFPETHENVFDRATMVDQQQATALSRTFSLPKTLDPATFSMELPVPVSGQVLAWTPTGLTNATVTNPNVVLPGEGRTTATLSAYLANNYVYNVLDYDAMGDGVTDDAAAINAAITAAALVGGTVVLPHGTFGVASPINITAKVAFVGMGEDKTIIKPLASFAGTAVVVVAPASTDTAYLVSDFSIDCASKTTAVALSCTNLDTSRVARLRLLTGAKGLVLSHCGSSHFDHIVMRNMTTAGIHFTGDNNGELGFNNIDIACDTGTMAAGVLYERTNGTDVGGIYMDFVRVIQAGAGVVTNGFKFSGTVTCGAFLFATRCVADGISGGHAWDFSNITEIRMQGCWGTSSALIGANLSGLRLNNSVNAQIHDGYYGSASRDISVTGTASRVLIHHNLLVSAATNLWEDGTSKTELLATENILVGATPYSGAYWLTASSAQPQFLTPVAFASDISATGGYRQTLFGWSQITTVAASQTDVVLTDAVAARGRVMTRAGSITGVGVNLSSARTAGTLTIKVQRSTDGGATWATVSGPTAVLNTNVKGARSTFGKDQYGFAAGDMLRLTVTTDSGWLPTANNLDACLEIET